MRIGDAAVVAAAELSDRYLTDRFLPDKAIDLVDRASARARMLAGAPARTRPWTSGWTSCAAPATSRSTPRTTSAPCC